MNILCEILPDKIRLYGDFSEEVIQTESRIGAIYLREGECLNAAEHLKAVNSHYLLQSTKTFLLHSSVLICKNSSMVRMILEHVKHEIRLNY